MTDLMTLNLFALSLPAALFGIGLLGALIVLPLLVRHDGAPGPGGRRPVSRLH